jgi:hypothetical protein
MRMTDDDLRAIWQERSEHEPAGCLTETEWARLLSKAADTAERMRAAAHIASCSTCAEEYRLLQPLESWGAEVEREFSPPDATATNRWTAWRAWWSPPRLGLVAAAATLLLAAQGVTLFQLVAWRRQNAQLETQLAENNRQLSISEGSLSTLQEQLQRETAAKDQLDALEREHQAQLSTPQLDFPIVDLKPRVAEVVRGPVGPEVVTTTSNALVTTLVLNFPPLPSRAMLEVEVADATGQVGWTGRTQRGQDTSTLTLALPTPGYPAGEYVIRLFDVTRGRTPLAVYPVIIRRAPEKQ